jgi:hypothetical protein
MAQAALELLDDARAAAALAARGRANAARFSRSAWFAAHAALYTSLGVGQRAAQCAGTGPP